MQVLFMKELTQFYFRILSATCHVSQNEFVIIKMKNITIDDAIRTTILTMRNIQGIFRDLLSSWSNTYCTTFNAEMYQRQWPFSPSHEGNVLIWFLMFALRLSDKQYFGLSSDLILLSTTWFRGLRMLPSFSQWDVKRCLSWDSPTSGLTLRNNRRPH